MNKYEEALKRLAWFSRDFDEKQEAVVLCEEACKKAELYDEKYIDPLYKESLLGAYKEKSKAFDIINKKKVIIHIINMCDSVKDYNSYISLLSNFLTKEEFDLIKNLLK